VLYIIIGCDVKEPLYIIWVLGDDNKFREWWYMLMYNDMGESGDADTGGDKYIGCIGVNRW
jgi:hypothetical protein